MSNLKIICDSLADVPENLVKRYNIELMMWITKME